MSQTIQVVFSIDDGYAKQLLVALTSLVHNTTSTIAVTVLDAGISGDQTARLRKGAAALGVEIRFLPIDRSFLAHFPACDSYRPVAYARLQLPDLLTEHDRVLYLDPDLIIRHDIAELWKTDLANVSAAVNRDIDYEVLDGVKKTLGFKPEHCYFNSGVMLLNLARMRATQFVSRAVAFAREHPRKITIVDQDVFNFLLRDDVTRFPLRWNFYPLYCLERPDGEWKWRNLSTYYSEQERRDAEKDPAIVHYANTFKPWQCSAAARLHPWYAEYFRYVDLYHDRLGGLTEPKATPRISVIMPCRNVEEFIQQAVESVLQQRVAAIEVIAINDGSTDQTGGMLDDFARWDRRITVLHQANRGLGATYNRGLNSAKADYVAFVEPDDWVDIDGFACLMRHADRIGCDIVKGDFCLVEGTAINRYFKYASEHLPEVCQFHEIEIAPHGHVGFWAGLYRREFLEREGIRFLELPGAGYVDASFLWISHISAESISIIPRAVYYYRQHPAASVGSAAFSRNWPLLIQNYEVVMDFLLAKGVAPLYIDNLLYVLYAAVSHTLSLLHQDRHAEVIQRVRPLFMMMHDVHQTRVPIPEHVRRGMRAIQQGVSPVRHGLKQQLQRRFRWITKDPRTAADVSRIRHSPIVQALKGGVRWGGECLLLALAFARLCKNTVRSLLPPVRERNRPPAGT